MMNLPLMGKNRPGPGPFERSRRNEKSTRHFSAPSQHATPLSTTNASDFAHECELIAGKRQAQPDRSSSLLIFENLDQEGSAAPSRAEGGSLPQKSRKGHKKSRQGCFNCKRRKIKCQETQPACGNCTKQNLECVYSATKIYLTPKTIITPLQGTPTMFSLTDMRLFHHFLFNAYPHISHLPVENDKVWFSQVPLVAHHNQHLMHAILGIAASHLELLTGMDLKSTAIHHRIHAIKGLNAAISTKRRTGCDADALLASCYLLTFQSSYMKDGLQEFFQVVRGCAILSNQRRVENLPITFFVTEEECFRSIEERLRSLPIIHEDLIRGARISLIALASLLDRPVNLVFYQVLFDTIQAAALSSVQVYFKFVTVYHFIGNLENEECKELISPKNLCGRILIAHFLAIQIVVSPILDREWNGKSRSIPIRNYLHWIYSVCDILSPETEKFNDWPKAVADSVKDELAGMQTALSRISVLRQEEGFNANVL